MLSIYSPVSQAKGIATDSGMAQGMRSVFLPDDYQTQEPAGSWEHGRIAMVLGLWLVGGLLVAVRTFRWQRRDAG